MWGNKLRLIKENSYAKMASQYQLEMLRCLNEALANNGVGKEQRLAILEDFGFTFGNMHDEESFAIQAHGNDFTVDPCRPVIGFKQKNYINIGEDFYLHHETAFGNANEAIKMPLSQRVSLYRRNKEASNAH